MSSYLIETWQLLQYRLAALGGSSVLDDAHRDTDFREHSLNWATVDAVDLHEEAVN